jgi:uncharacterized protein YecE (DUF72 family)
VSSRAVYVGTSGWAYRSWRGDFYPTGLRQRDELAFLGARMNSVEINGSFYSLQRPSSYRAWASAVPAEFVFAVKGGRFITHMLQLRNTHDALANFFASGVLLLGDKLGPILWQLPARTSFDAETIGTFLSALPTTLTEAATLAAEHNEKVKHVELPEKPSVARIRYVVEARHESFADVDALDLLRAHGVALALSDSADHWPVLQHGTADFAYLRLHGHGELYAGGYDAPALAKWADAARQLAGDAGDIYVYFDNDARGHAPFDAVAMANLLSI